MFAKIEHLKEEFETEIKFTENVFAAMTDESLSQEINNDHRTIGRMAWHIVQTIPEMAGAIGIKCPIDKEAPMPASAAEIKSAYSSASSAVLKFVTENWTDETLMQEDDLYGEVWKRGKTLLIILKHEIHHRGQMTVLMRQAGVVVPDIYGPAKEGWGKYGGEPPQI